MKSKFVLKGLKVAALGIICLFLNFNLMAQNAIEVTGTVVGSDGDPLPGVTVVQESTTNGTVTDVNGKYTIKLPSNSVLLYSFVGMKPQKNEVSGQTTINVTMEVDAIGMDEVVVIGYGTSKKSDLTGSVGSVSASELRESPITRIEEGLQGKIAGVRVQNTDGSPGGGSKVRIRGVSSISFSNDPLYVIDGFIGADMATINPKDIQTIDILKDASATAIYGSRGANGVVIITTNTPKAGDMKVTFDASYGIANIPDFLPMSDYNQSLEWINEKAIAEGGTAAITPSEMEELIAFGGTDWQDQVTQSGAKTDVNIGLAGGTDKLKYFVSANYYDEQGVILESNYKRYSLRSNISSKIGENVDLTFNTFGTAENRSGTGRITNGQYGIIGKAFNFPRVWPAYDDEGNLTNPDEMNDYKLAVNPGGRSNPLASIVDPISTNETYTIQSNIDLSFKITDYLKLLVSNSGKYRSGYWASQGSIRPPETYRKDVTVSQNNSQAKTIMNYDVLTFDKDFGDHSIKVDAIYEFSKSVSNSNRITVSELSTLATGYYNLEVGSPSGTQSAYNEVKWRSYMGRLNYSFKDKYLFTASVRADGSSKFQEDNRWGYFPSAALAWRISEESFIKDSETISNLKFRIGYGQVGNASLPAYSTLQLLNAGANYDYNESTETVIESGVRPGNLVDPDIKWEISKQFNVGLDWGLFNGRLSGVIDYYDKNVDDLIFNMQIPSINGTSSYLTNIGNIKNSGIEFAVYGIIIDKTDFSLSANFNISFNKSEVLDLGDVNRMWLGNGGFGIPNVSDLFVINKGEALGQLWGYKYFGTWKTGEETEAARYGAKPGNARYEDVDDSGNYGSEDKQVIAETTPKTNIGFGINMKYKNIDLAVSGYGAMGYDIYNQQFTYANMYDDPNMANRWTPENQTNVPIWDTYSDLSWGQPTSRKVESGNFIKISTFTLGYTFSKANLERIGIDKARIYLSGNNLFTFSDYSGLDPESSITPLNSDAIGGVDNFAYPQTRTFTLGVNFTF